MSKATLYLFLQKTLLLWEELILFILFTLLFFLRYKRSALGCDAIGLLN